MLPMTRQKLLPYSFLLPALAITGVVIIYPVFQTLLLSVQNYVLYAPDEARYIGLQNFQKLLKDEVFWISLSHSVIWVISIVLLQLLLGLGSALLLNQSFWWRGVARALVIVPWALPSVIIGLIWTWIYDYNVGVLNDLLLRAHLIDQPVAWLSHPQTSFAAIMLTLVWQGFPFFAVMILAGLQTVPQELYEAARIDGAGAWWEFWAVTLPGLRYEIAVVLVLTVTAALRNFDIIYVMTSGGPGTSTIVPSYLVYQQAFIVGSLGGAAAIGFVLAVMIALINSSMCT
jgi:multiple sugar transport system permease protein